MKLVLLSGGSRKHLYPLQTRRELMNWLRRAHSGIVASLHFGLGI